MTLDLWPVFCTCRFESATSRCRSVAFTNWTMKPLTLGAGHLWVPLFPWWMNQRSNYIWNGDHSFTWFHIRSSVCDSFHISFHRWLSFQPCTVGIHWATVPLPLPFPLPDVKFSLIVRQWGQRQRKVDDNYVNIFRIYTNVFLLFLSSLPHYQAEYLTFRKWPIQIPSEELGNVLLYSKLYFMAREWGVSENTINNKNVHVNIKDKWVVYHLEKISGNFGWFVNGTPLYGFVPPENFRERRDVWKGSPVFPLKTFQWVLKGLTSSRLFTAIFLILARKIVITGRRTDLS